MSWVRIGFLIGLLAVPACGTSGSGGIGAVSCGSTENVGTLQPGVVKIAITGTATDRLDPEAWMYRYAERLAADLFLRAEWVVVPFDKSWELAGKDVVDLVATNLASFADLSARKEPPVTNADSWGRVVGARGAGAHGTMISWRWLACRNSHGPWNPFTSPRDYDLEHE